MLTGSQEFDLDEYLPAITMEVCNRYLVDRGFETPIFRGAYNEDHKPIHAIAYATLRDGLRDLFRDHGNDALPECEKPGGARFWRPTPENDAMFREAHVGVGELRVQTGDEELVEILQQAGRLPVNVRPARK